MRNSNIRPGDVVAIQGIGGLGHLAVQYANKMGMRTVALSHSDDKKKLAKDLGAHHYINSKKDDAVKELQKLGGAKLIVATAPHADAISAVIDGLGVDGQLICIGATGDAMEVSPMQLLQQRKSVSGWPSGTAIDSEDTLNFSAMTNTKPMIETYKLDDVEKAFKRMMDNKARFRVVLVP